MIGIIATCDVRRIGLISHFVEHYRYLGVEAFHLSLHVSPGTSPGAARRQIAEAECELAVFGLQLEAVLREPFDAAALRRHHDAVQARVAGRYDALVWADIDELHELPRSLASFVDRMRSSGWSALRGQFVDRVSRSGKLAPILPATSIWSQFPIGTNLTGQVLKGSVDKVVLAQPCLRISPGNHGPAPGQNVRWWPTTVPVHHFKWDITVLSRLSERLTDDCKRRCYWWTQSDEAISWIKAGGGRIDLGQLLTYDFEDDGIGSAGPYGANPRYSGGLYW